MIRLFLTVLNMSIAASWIVLAVVLLRLLLKKAPKWMTVLLWGMVALRLCCPVFLESPMSLIPSAQTISPDILTDPVPQISSGLTFVNSAINPILSDALASTPDQSADPLQLWLPILAGLWAAGALGLWLYMAISYLLLRKRVAQAVLLRDNIYQCEQVASPFVLGLFRPRIYLPCHISPQDTELVIAHEQAHISRRDTLWKPLGFLLLSLHWFNPFLWLGYGLLCRDIELACDERVVKKLSAQQRADYSQALLTCSVHPAAIAACPLAFGEVGVKERVKTVLSYKKPAFWIIVLAMLALALTALCLLTDPMDNRLQTIENMDLSGFLTDTVSIMYGDGTAHFSAENFSEETVQALLALKISKDPVSLDRSETRDKSHTLVLQNMQNIASPYSYLLGLRLHFNEDFTQVWADDGVKATLSYRVGSPQQAKALFQGLCSELTADDLGTDQTLPAATPDVNSMYADLDTSQGLSVYIWQLAENSYSCVLLPGKDRAYSLVELLEYAQSSVSLKNMQQIVASYFPAISEADVSIRAITMPHSSYLYTIDDAYLANLKALFWDYPQTDDYIIDQIHFDVDGDGTLETCYLGPGPTSGLFSFAVYIVRDDQLLYRNIFLSQFYHLRFATEDGALQVVGDTQIDPSETHIYELLLVDGSIQLRRDGTYLSAMEQIPLP